MSYLVYGIENALLGLACFWIAVQTILLMRARPHLPFRNLLWSGIGFWVSAGFAAMSVSLPLPYALLLRGICTASAWTFAVMMQCSMDAIRALPTPDELRAGLKTEAGISRLEDLAKRMGAIDVGASG